MEKGEGNRRGRKRENEEMKRRLRREWEERRGEEGEVRENTRKGEEEEE